MKKFTIYLAFLAAVLGSYGCHKEDSTPTEETLIVPVVKSIEATRASAADKAEQLLFSVPVKSDAGEEYTLEAWISDTECGMPETKGIPTTKDNLQSFKTKAYCNDLSVYSGMKEATATKNGEGWSYDKTYKWPAAEYCPLTFCSYAPGDLDITLESSPKAASFTYTLPEPTEDSNDAVNQKDLLFAMDTHDRSDTGEIDINFKHALTAVKFIKGEISNCTISSISLVNFHDSGTAKCDNGNLTWTAGTTTENYTQSFNTGVDDLNDGESLDLDKDHESRTFMVIPQKLPNNAKIVISLDSSTITYDVGSATDTKVKDWSEYAGKTVTFKVNKWKPSCYDIILLVDGSRSMGQKMNWDSPTGNVEVRKAIMNTKSYFNFITRFIGDTKVKFSLMYFGGAPTYSTISSNTKFFELRSNGYSLQTVPSFPVNHLMQLTTENTKRKYSSGNPLGLFDYTEDKFSSLSTNYSALFAGLYMSYWELYHYGQTGSKKVIIVISDGVPCAVEFKQNAFDDYNAWSTNSTDCTCAANLSIDATNNYTHGLICQSDSKPFTADITAKQIKAGYTVGDKTIKAEIYSILAMHPNDTKNPTERKKVMKSISSNCPEAESLTKMGTYHEDGYYYEMPSNGDLNEIFTTIYNKIMN